MCFYFILRYALKKLRLIIKSFCLNVLLIKNSFVDLTKLLKTQNIKI